MYKIFNDGINIGVIELARNIFIPPIPALSEDWQKYQVWLALGNTPSPDDINTLANLKLVKAQAIRDKYALSIESLMTDYSIQERESFYLQLKEVEAYKKDVLALTPMLDALAAAYGVTKAIVASKIATRAANYASAVGNLLGLQQKLIAQIIAAVTKAEVNAIII